MKIPRDVNVKRTVFRFFLWKNKQDRNKRDKIKRVRFCKDFDEIGRRIVDIEALIKSLRLDLIPRRFCEGHHN